MAEQFKKENTNIDWPTEEDLLSAGYEALIIAARTYGASREASFKTYATAYIKNAMLAEIMNNINYEH
jgi:DNA-directed RNA polymerase specialized sigma subunit